MHNLIFRKLFSKKWELLILGIVVIITTIASKAISIEHWESINWDLSSYSPWTPIIGMIWACAYLSILYLRKIRAPSLWLIGLLGLGYSGLMYWAIWINAA